MRDQSSTSGPGRPADSLDVLVEVFERENAALAARLHDGPVQLLTAASLHLQSASHFGELTPALADDVAASIAEAAGELRRVMSSLVAWWSSSGDLGQAVRRQVEQLCAAAGVRLELRLECDRSLAPRHSGIGYRVALEAVENALRHSGTEEIDVRIACTDDELVVEVRDTGSGFDFTTSPEGAGLELMQRRVKSVGGVLVLDGDSGTGTTVRAVIPRAG